MLLGVFGLIFITVLGFLITDVVASIVGRITTLLLTEIPAIVG